MNEKIVSNAPMMQTIWLSPVGYVTGDPTLRISYPYTSHPGTDVTCVSPGDLKSG